MQAYICWVYLTDNLKYDKFMMMSIGGAEISFYIRRSPVWECKICFFVEFNIVLKLIGLEYIIIVLNYINC